jgi:RNA polymerase sigma factor (sigma-70 family)
MSATTTRARRAAASRSTHGERIPPFQAFLEEHRGLVYRFLVASAGPGEADDCFQETFLAALRAYPKLRNADNLRGWILAIARRKAIDAWRSRRRRPQPWGDSALEAERPYRDPEPMELDDPLWQAVRELPPRQRVALVHRVLLDRSYAEVSARLGTTDEAARANVYQALKKLRERVGEA